MPRFVENVKARAFLEMERLHERAATGSGILLKQGSVCAYGDESD